MKNRLVLFFFCLVLTGLTTLVGCGKSASDSNNAASIGTGGSGNEKSESSNQTNKNIAYPEVVIETSLGKIQLRLDPENSPLTVDNFVRYVDASSYNQTIVHQVYKGQGILAGGFTINGNEIRAVGQAVLNEAHNGLKNRRGTVAMVRQPDATDSATSQFFINVADNQALDYRSRTPQEYGYCVFGEVIEGMEVVDKIADGAVHDTENFEQTPVQTVVIMSIRRVK